VRTLSISLPFARYFRHNNNLLLSNGSDLGTLVVQLGDGCVTLGLVALHVLQEFLPLQDLQRRRQQSLEYHTPQLVQLCYELLHYRGEKQLLQYLPTTSQMLVAIVKR